MKIPKTRVRNLRTWSPGNNPCELIGSLENNNKLSLIDLASNDYLGLSKHPKLIEAAQQAMLSEGLGAGASRFVTGSRPIHKKLEETLSQWLNFEKVFLFPSGFQANIAAINLLASRHTPVLADKLIHYSLLMGIKSIGAKVKRFAHNDIANLEQLIKQSIKEKPNEPPLVITESLFSMEGTCPNIKEIASLCQQSNSKLLVDEAHALGVMGYQGRGMSYGLSEAVTMISGTFGKAFGSGGAFLATNNKNGEKLLQTSGAFRYTTALAPPLAAAALEALKLIQANPNWGKQIQEKSKDWRTQLLKEGWNIPYGNGPIIPLILGSDEESLNKQIHLEANGLLTIAIRPPTVPEGTSRLRIVISKNLPENTLERFMCNLGQQR